MSSPEVSAHDSTRVREFEIGFPKSERTELRRRIDATQWPEKETVDDDSQGVPLAMMQDLARHWVADYDWSRCETELNGLPNYYSAPRSDRCARRTVRNQLPPKDGDERCARW